MFSFWMLLQRLSNFTTCSFWSSLFLGTPQALARENEQGPNSPLGAFLNLDDFIGYKAVSFAVYPFSCLLIGSLDKAEYLAIALIKPIFQVLDAVLLLRLYICLMRV